MARALVDFRLTLIALLLLVVSPETYAQSNTTPGLPWTYVPSDSLPAGAIDTAFEYSIFKHGQDSTSDIRWIYRVNCHIRLTEVTDSNTFFIEVPRHPDSFGFEESVERIEMSNPFIDTITTAVSNSYYIGSGSSRSHPEYFFPQLEFEEDIRLDLNGDTIETSYFGSIVRIPQRNFIIENRSDTSYRSYAYFVQYIDSIWFPTISAVETPKEASHFSTYPNPTESMFSIDLPETDFTNLDGYIMRIYDPTARILDTRRVRSHSALKNLIIPNGGMPGVYTITLYDKRGRLAIGRIIKND